MHARSDDVTDYYVEQILFINDSVFELHAESDDITDCYGERIFFANGSFVELMQHTPRLPRLGLSVGCSSAAAMGLNNSFNWSCSSGRAWLFKLFLSLVALGRGVFMDTPGPSSAGGAANQWAPCRFPRGVCSWLLGGFVAMPAHE